MKSPLGSLRAFVLFSRTPVYLWDIADPNHFLFTYWQYVTGRFTPRNVKYGKYYSIHRLADAKDAARDIGSGKYKMMCLNDTVSDGENFEQIKETVNEALQSILPEKSAFEI